MKNACVIGYGAIGPIHAAALENTDNVNLYGICDIKTDLAVSAAKKHGCKAFFDFNDVLKDPNVDSVHICTPHYLHCAMAVAAAEAGKEIVLEKPVAINLEEMKKTEETLKNSKVCVMVQNRLNGAVCEFRRMIKEDKTLGRLRGGFASQTWSRGKSYYEHDEWRGKWETEGGGVLINQAVHLIDLVSYVAGEIKSVSASISNKTLRDIIEVEDTADAIFTLENNVKVCYYVTNGYSSFLPARLELQFENAVLRYADNMLCKITEENVEVIAKNSDYYGGKKDWGNSHDVVINNFYNGGYYPTLRDTKNSMTALFKIYESAENDSKEMEI